jgi:hypothetical protein
MSVQRQIRRAWTVFAIVLIATLIAEFFIPSKTPFESSQWWSFAALFGFFSCFIMVITAKVLGYVLKKPENYYSEQNDV